MQSVTLRLRSLAPAMFRATSSTLPSASTSVLGFAGTSSPACGLCTAPQYSREAVYTDGSVFTRDRDSEIFRRVEFPTDDEDAPHLDVEFRELVNELFATHRPSQHSFFRTLKEAPSDVVRDPAFLEEFYIRYQAAMHITRAMVWYAPHLDTPILRQRKIAVIADDDALDGKTSHHVQLENMFRRFGANPLHQEEFGEPSELKKVLHPSMHEFVDTVVRLYPSTTGAWCLAEVLSDDWLSALADSLSPHFDNVMEEQYFDESVTGHVELIHILETVSITENVLARHPEKREATFAHAREMAAALDKVWVNLENLVKDHVAARSA